MKRACLGLLLALLAGPAFAECPNWIDGEASGPPVGECWCPSVSYRHNVGPTVPMGQPVKYVYRLQWLCYQGQMFSTRPEVEAYIESGAIKGLWEFDALVCDGGESKCRWVPASAFDKIDLVQINHQGR